MSDELPDVLTCSDAAIAIGRPLQELARMCMRGDLPYVLLPGAACDSFVTFSVRTHGIERSVVEGLRSPCTGPSDTTTATFPTEQPIVMEGWPQGNPFRA